MRRTQSDRKEQQASLWIPGTNRQGRLTYDLQQWPAEPESAGNGRLCDEVILKVRHVLEGRLSDERRRDLKGRAIRFVAFYFGVRNQDWGQALVQEMSQTLDHAWENLRDDPTVVASGCKVRHRQVLVSCCLTPDQEMVEKLLARLDGLEDNEHSQYLLSTFTDETVPRGPQEKGKSDAESTRPALDEEVAGRIHQLFHDTMKSFTAHAAATLESLKPHLRTLLVTTPPETYEGKQVLVDKLNKLFHAADVALKHPSRNEPVTLLAVRGGARNRKGYIQIRPTRGGEILALPDEDPQLIQFRRYRGSGPATEQIRS